MALIEQPVAHDDGTRQRRRSKNKRLRQAVHRHKSKEGIQERLFTLAFSGLVYPQILEDPLVDLEALSLKEDEHLVAIASGGCNLLSYLATAPIRITAIDLNPAHVALNKLKLAAIRHLLDYAALHRFFAEADAHENVRAYEHYIRPHLDEMSRRYWEARNLLGCRRIGYFRTNLYRHGLLGTFIGASHLLARMPRPEPQKNPRSQEPRRAAQDLRERTRTSVREAAHPLVTQQAVSVVRARYPAIAVQCLERQRDPHVERAASAVRATGMRFRPLGQLLRMASIRPALRGRPSATLSAAWLSDRIDVCQADATAFDTLALCGEAQVGRVLISYTFSMIPPWRQVLPQALAAVGPGGRLHILDFGQLEAWPRWFRAVLFAWLRQFSVYPRAELEPELTKLASDTGAELEFRRLYRGYADYAVAKR